jgi:hypothetical protein
MGKFMEAKFAGTCKQTGASIQKGDHIFYIPGRGSFHKDSTVYKDNKENSDTKHYIQAQEEAYFDNFALKNNI